MRMRHIFGCFALLGVLGAVVAAAEPITFDSLLDEMVNRTAVAKFPSPAYTCKQASSYDRGSKSPDEGWFANNDRSMFIRKETNAGREEWVMMDVEGPGAIVRWWVTAPAYEGIIRIYLDGATEPMIEAKVDDLVGGTALVGPPLSEETARGRNLYLPIPYAKHCKVTFDRPNFQKTQKREDLLYYQINYRTYAKGADVKSFAKDTLEKSKAKVDAVQKTLLDPASALPKDCDTQEGEGIMVFPGDEWSQEIDGPGAICRLSARIDADDVAQALRSTILVMEFDGEETVWCPLGDFFGSGVGVNAYKGWYRQVKEDGTLTCYWVMPYKESCVIKVKNVGGAAVEFHDTTISFIPWEWNDRSMHFHADWRVQREIETADGGRKALDWNYVKLKGEGVFVGDTVAILNRVAAWWGEGDEKIYVDGETFPSHFGTGTEDYYGYAWCTPEFFESPFHAQPRAEGPGNFGNTTNTRVRLLDAIPFTKSFQFDMEVWHWRKTLIDYAATTYWYGRPGAESNIESIVEDAMHPVKYNTPIELPGFDFVKMPKGRLQIQDLTHFKKGVWENDDHLWWTGAKPGNKLELKVAAETAGKYSLTVTMTKAPDYAIVQYYLDGKKIGEPIDLYATSVEPTGKVKLGDFDLSAGEHVLTVEIVGANPKAKKSYMFGLDRILIEK